MHLSSPVSDSLWRGSRFWQSWYNCNVGLGGTECRVRLQTSLSHPVLTSQGSKTGEERVAERVWHLFSTPYPNNPYLSEMPLPQNHGATPLSTPVVRVIRYGDKQLAHSKVRRGILLLLAFKNALLHQSNKAASHGKKWTTLIWTIQYVFVIQHWFGGDS